MPDTSSGSPPEDKARLPDSEEVRKTKRLASLASETDDDRSARRATELKVHILNHLDTVASLQTAYPTRSIPFELMDESEQKRWNEKRALIDAANVQYHKAVKLTVSEHAFEDSHFAKLRAALKTAL